jgi:hypothetical protein
MGPHPTDAIAAPLPSPDAPDALRRHLEMVTPARR